MHRPRLLVLAALAALVGLAGCGGDGDETETVTDVDTVVETAPTPQACPTEFAGGPAEIELGSSGLDCAGAQEILDAFVVTQHSLGEQVEVQDGFGCEEHPNADYPLLVECESAQGRFELLGTAESAHEGGSGDAAGTPCGALPGPLAANFYDIEAIGGAPCSLAIQVTREWKNLCVGGAPAETCQVGDFDCTQEQVGDEVVDVTCDAGARAVRFTVGA